MGTRMPIGVSRKIIREIVSGRLTKKWFVTHLLTGLSIPNSFDTEVDQYLCPERRWKSFDQYEDACTRLMTLFEEKKNEI